MTLIETYKLACKLHANQSDKAGSPYIEHLTRVMLLTQAAGGDTEQQIAALLHDSIEDGHADADSLREAGVPEGAIVLIVAHTREARTPWRCTSARQPFLSLRRYAIHHPQKAPSRTMRD